MGRRSNRLNNKSKVRAAKAIERRQAGVQPCKGGWAVRFDGGCNPNPGGVPRWAFVVFRADGFEFARFRGETPDAAKRTNNTAEFEALAQALAWALRRREVLSGCPGLNVYGDSKLTVYGVNQGWKFPASPHLLALRKTCDGLIAALHEFFPVRLLWEPRAKNEVADSLTKGKYVEPALAPA